jgi:hypothetical protein
VWNWFKRKHTDNAPNIPQAMIGELHITSGTILLADPMYLNDSDVIRIEGVPPGRCRVWGQVIRFSEGGERLARIGLRLRPGIAQTRRPLGEIPVDSAIVVAVDEQAYVAGWREIGTERIGCASGHNLHQQIAKLIGRQFGLKSHEVNAVRSEFDEPISEELEEQIKAYLRTFPFYAERLSSYFYIDTKNTFDCVQECIGGDRLWGEVVLDANNGFNLLAFSSGFGDGSYKVEGLFDADELRCIEIEFIGASQDNLLEAFPLLRY